MVPRAYDADEWIGAQLRFISNPLPRAARAGEGRFLEYCRDTLRPDTNATGDAKRNLMGNPVPAGIGKLRSADRFRPLLDFIRPGKHRLRARRQGSVAPRALRLPQSSADRVHVVWRRLGESIVDLAGPRICCRQFPVRFQCPSSKLGPGVGSIHLRACRFMRPCHGARPPLSVSHAAQRRRAVFSVSLPLVARSPGIASPLAVRRAAR